MKRRLLPLGLVLFAISLVLSGAGHDSIHHEHEHGHHHQDGHDQDGGLGDEGHGCQLCGLTLATLSVKLPGLLEATARRLGSTPTPVEVLSSAPLGSAAARGPPLG